MRDKRFIAEHCGGLLTKDNHLNLMRWAIDCCMHILPLIDRETIDHRLYHALQVARDWENGNVKVGEAMKASLSAHAVARQSASPIITAIARAIGHTVATAHMADHSLGAALYALKALNLAGKPIDSEKEWQNKRLQELPSEIVELVQTTLVKKSVGLK